MSGLSINSACADGLHDELTKLQQIGASLTNIIYSPLILNTILIMFYFNQTFKNLFVPMEIAPYGGYQLTLTSDRASESDADIIVNNNVNELIHSFMTVSNDKGIQNTKIAVSLMFIDPRNAANNHANIIIFLKIVNEWYVYHYEPHGRNLERIFPHWFRTGTICINNLLGRLRQLGVNILIKPHVQTRIIQTQIDKIQGITEGGYCQIISALQAYLFLKFCKVMGSNPTTNTPLGSSIKSPNIGRNADANYQLKIIRGFVNFISGEIQRLLNLDDIHVRIDTLSRINANYQQQAILTGRNRPLYLLYLDAVLRFISNEIRQGKINLYMPCIQDCTGIVTSPEVGVDFAELDRIVTPLLGMLNGSIVLTKAAKLNLYSELRTAKTDAEREAAERAAAERAAAEKDLKKREAKEVIEKANVPKKPKKGGSTRKYKKRTQRYKRRKGKSGKRRKPKK